MTKRKLIEVALPLEGISVANARAKPGKAGATPTRRMPTIRAFDDNRNLEYRRFQP